MAAYFIYDFSISSKQTNRKNNKQIKVVFYENLIYLKSSAIFSQLNDSTARTNNNDVHRREKKHKPKEKKPTKLTSKKMK